MSGALLLSAAAADRTASGVIASRAADFTAGRSSAYQSPTSAISRTAAVISARGSQRGRIGSCWYEPSTTTGAMGAWSSATSGVATT